MEVKRLNFAEINIIVGKLKPIYWVVESNSTHSRHPAFKSTPKIFRDKIAIHVGIQSSTGGLFYEHPIGLFVHFFDYSGFPREYTACTTVLIPFEELGEFSENYPGVQ